MNQVIHGDCLEKLKDIEDNSVDLVVTDPPYGIGFMGKAWDTFTPEYVEKMNQQNAKRPPRTDGRTVPIGGIARDAGTYDHSLQGNSSFRKFITEVGIELLRVMKPGAFIFMSMAPRQDSLAAAICGLEEAGLNTGFTSIYWTYATGFPKAMNISKMVDKRMGLDRPRKDVPVAAKDKAKILDGSYGGFQPKPAVEVIIVAMKPLSEKTYVDQALKNGKGITWLEDVRIPTGGIRFNSPAGNTGKEATPIMKSNDNYEGEFVDSRFPANLLVSDDILNSKISFESMSGETVNADMDFDSRFFSLDAWWAKTFPFLIVPKAAKSEKNKNLGEDLTDNSDKYNGKFPESKADKLTNKHPTVKPLKLMSYLIMLGSRKGDTILDPFAGSGTTLVAAQQLDRKFIGIEREEEYVKIAEARLSEKQQRLL